MALTITDQVMRSPYTAHTATAWPVPDEPTLWTVTWLPGRNLTRVQANAAMLIAESVGQIPADAEPEAYSDTFWRHVDVLAAELGLSGPDAVVRASEAPGPTPCSRCGHASHPATPMECEGCPEGYCESRSADEGWFLDGDPRDDGWIGGYRPGIEGD